MGNNNTGAVAKKTNFITEFSDLRKQRLDWETKELKAAHDRLYSIIADTYRLYIDASKDDFTAVAAQQNIKITKATTNAMLAAKFVFGVQDTRRNSMIAKVLQKAEAEQRTADEVADWIREKGGIEAIRLDMPKTEVSSKADEGRKKVKALQAKKFTLAADVLSDFTPDNDGFLVHLSRKNAENGHDVLYVLNDKSVLDAIFAAVQRAEEANGTNPEATPAVGKTAIVEVEGVTSKGFKAALNEAIAS